MRQTYVIYVRLKCDINVIDLCNIFARHVMTDNCLECSWCTRIQLLKFATSYLSPNQISSYVCKFLNSNLIQFVC